MARIACFFATSGHSGVDRIAGHLLPALARRGHEVDLLKVEGHGPRLSERARAWVQVVALGCAHTYTSLPAVVAYLRRRRPDVLLADKDRVNRVALLARALAGVKTRLVLSSGTTLSVDLAHRGPWERRLQRLSMGKLYRFAHKVIVPCRGVKEDLVAYTGLASEHIEVVPPPVVPEALLERRPPPPDHPWFRDGGPPVVLGVGELCYRKDFETLLKAFALASGKRPLRLVILGRGRRLRRLEGLALSLGIRDRVDFPGFVPDPYPYMAHAALFALTSRWEGLGFVLIEALALGTPAVAADCPSGPGEILQQGRYGRLVPVGDHRALAEAILLTLAAPPPRAHLREAARPYTIERATQAYLTAMGLA